MSATDVPWVVLGFSDSGFSLSLSFSLPLSSLSFFFPFNQPLHPHTPKYKVSAPRSLKRTQIRCTNAAQGGQGPG